MKMERVREPAALPLGFLWGAVAAGIKTSGNLDVAVAVAPGGATAVAMFTTNQVVAAPLVIGRGHLASTGGQIRAVLVNAGNANCATGEPGLQACLETCQAAAQTFGCIFDEVFPSSTGIIGVPLPTAKILAALPHARAALGDTPAHAEAFATAIMTTDTRPKVARALIDVDGVDVHIFGVAKGAGMVHPQLGSTTAGARAASTHATMLVYLFTDLAAAPEQLGGLLQLSAEQSFNSISIDGDTSTNDTVLLLASGASGVTLDHRVRAACADALDLVCSSLAHQIVDDGEGVTHVVTLEISGADTVEDARRVAKAIALSPLNKTAWSSADPNWGRLLAAAGASGVTFRPDRVSIAIGDQLVFEHGMRAVSFDREAAHTIMSRREYTIRLNLGEGSARCSFLTCDLTEEYVRINANYST